MGIKCACEGGIHRFTMYLKRIRKRNTVEQQGTYKVRNEIETKRNETKRNQRKRNETKRNETKRKQQKRNETKRNQRNENEIKRNQRKQNPPTHTH